MANTILEKLQELYPNAEGINDARNIAEAVGAIRGTGGRGANAISDQIYETCEVIINLNNGAFKDGSQTRTMRVKKGENITLPTEEDIVLPETKEYIKKWTFTEKGGIIGVDVEGSAVEITKDGTLKAFYGDILTIRFDPNGGEGSVAPIVIKPLQSGYSFLFPSASSLTPPEGQTFAGWGTATDTPPNQTSQPSEGASDNSYSGSSPNLITYYAIWQ